jgi:hypothetical protein
VAYLNKWSNQAEQNYSMLIHTSGKKVDHKADWYVFDKIITALSDSNSKDRIVPVSVEIGPAGAMD